MIVDQQFNLILFQRSLAAALLNDSYFITYPYYHLVPVTKLVSSALYTGNSLLCFAVSISSLHLEYSFSFTILHLTVTLVQHDSPT